MTVSWQKVFSTLAAPRFRGLYAQAVLGWDLDATPKEIAKLLDSGLLQADGTVNDALFKDVLAAGTAQRPQGVDRFFSEGRIEGVPRNPAERDQLLGHLAERLLPDFELPERQVNLLLGTVTGDVPLLRRALVDYGFVERNIDGTGYRRAA